MKYDSKNASGSIVYNADTGDRIDYVIIVDDAAMTVERHVEPFRATQDGYLGVEVLEFERMDVNAIDVARYEIRCYGLKGKK